MDTSSYYASYGERCRSICDVVVCTPRRYFLRGEFDTLPMTNFV